MIKAARDSLAYLMEYLDSAGDYFALDTIKEINEIISKYVPTKTISVVSVPK